MDSFAGKDSLDGTLIPVISRSTKSGKRASKLRFTGSLCLFFHRDRKIRMARFFVLNERLASNCKIFFVLSQLQSEKSSRSGRYNNCTAFSDKTFATEDSIFCFLYGQYSRVILQFSHTAVQWFVFSDLFRNSSWNCFPRKADLRYCPAVVLTHHIVNVSIVNVCM